MGNNFIGPNEILRIQKELGVLIPENIWDIVPDIPYSEEMLSKYHDEYILILGIPYYKDGSSLTLVKMREHFGCDPYKYEPCFYNQDWYLNETFVNSTNISLKWYLIRKEVDDSTRGKFPEIINEENQCSDSLPKALLLTFVFFAYYLHSGGNILWNNDYVWCSDRDINNDQIYVGRYSDPNKINKNGFSIHRFLSITRLYGQIDCL